MGECLTWALMRGVRCHLNNIEIIVLGHGVLYGHNGRFLVMYGQVYVQAENVYVIY